MDFSSYYYYIPLNFYETPEMTLIDHEPNRGFRNRTRPRPG